MKALLNGVSSLIFTFVLVALMSAVLTMELRRPWGNGTSFGWILAVIAVVILVLGLFHAIMLTAELTIVCILLVALAVVL